MPKRGFGYSGCAPNSRLSAAFLRARLDAGLDQVTDRVKARREPMGEAEVLQRRGHFWREPNEIFGSEAGGVRHMRHTRTYIRYR
jgi:hypothetical protein